MAKERYKLVILFDDGEEEVVEEWFDTPEEAEEEYLSWLENYPVGMEALRELDDEDCSSASITGYRIYVDKNDD